MAHWVADQLKVRLQYISSLYQIATLLLSSSKAFLRPEGKTINYRNARAISNPTAFIQFHIPMHGKNEKWMGKSGVALLLDIAHADC